MHTKSPKQHKISKRPLRKLLSGLVAASTAIAAFLIPLPSGASNPATHIDENFNTTGFATFPTGSDSVEVVGHFEVPGNVSERRFSVSIENGQAVLRAYIPTVISGSFNFPWSSSNATSPVMSFEPDATFGASGLLNLKDASGVDFTGVSSILLDGTPNSTELSISTDRNTASGRFLRPVLMVVSGTGASTKSHLIYLDRTKSADSGLLACTTNCSQLAVDVTQDITAKTGNVEDSVPTGFVLRAGEDSQELYASGVKRDGTIFIVKLHFGIRVTNAERIGNDVRYTTSPSPNWSGTGVNTNITVTGVNPAGYNLTNVVSTRNGNLVTVSSADAGATGAYVSGGVIRPASGLGVDGGTDKRRDYLELAMPGAFQQGWQSLTDLAFVPIKNGVKLSSNVLYVVGNLVAPNGVSRGALLRRDVGIGATITELQPNAANPQDVWPSDGYSRTFKFIGSSASNPMAYIGGSDQETQTSKARPLIIASNDEFRQDTQELFLPVTSELDETLLAVRGTEFSPLGNNTGFRIRSAKAIASNGNGISVHTWDDSARLTTSHQSFGLSGTTPTSAFIAVGSSGNFMNSYVGFEKPSNQSVIVSSLFQANASSDGGSSGSTTDGDSSGTPSDSDSSGTPTASNPAPATLTGGGSASKLVTEALIPTIQQTPGKGSAGTISGGVVTPVTATVSRVTATTPVEIRTQAINMKAAFDSRGGDSGKITVVETPTGASIFGLIKNTVTNQPIGVPAQDVLMVSTANQAVLLAAATNNQPAKVNSNGVLVVNNGGLLGAAANGFTANTQGELVLLSTPTLLGNFTTDATGSFAGQAVIPAGFPVGNHTAVLITSDLVTSMGVTVEPAIAAGLASTGVNRSIIDSWLAMAGLLAALGLVMVLAGARRKEESA